MITYLIASFFTGTALGSFINMAVYRLEKEQNFGGRSYCDFCKKPLTGIALIPFFSYILLKGKSQCCKKTLSPQMPLVEFVSGVSVLLIAAYSLGLLKNLGLVPFYTFNSYIQIFFFLLFVLLYMAIATIFIYDLKFMEVPMGFVYLGIVLALIMKIANYFIYKIYLVHTLNSTTLGKYVLQTDYIKDRMSFFVQDNLTNLIVVFCIALFFLLMVIVTKGKGMGMGDVYVAPFLALLLPYPKSIIYIFLSFIIGGIFGVFLIVAKKAGGKTAVPFVPFLITGFIVALLFGDAIIRLLS